MLNLNWTRMETWNSFSVYSVNQEHTSQQKDGLNRVFLVTMTLQHRKGAMKCAQVHVISYWPCHRNKMFRIILSPHIFFLYKRKKTVE